MLEKKDNTSIIGIFSGILFQISFFVIGFGSVGMFGFSSRLTGGLLIQSAFREGTTTSVIVGLVVIIAVLCSLMGAWQYYKNNPKQASVFGKICLTIFVIPIIYILIKSESMKLLGYMGLGAWLTLLSAAGLAIAPKINNLIGGINLSDLSKSDNLSNSNSEINISDPALKAEEAVLTSKLQLEPLNIDLLLKHGDVLVQCGMLQEATQEWEKVLALDSSHHSALIQITRIYCQLSQYENAEKRLKQLSALSLTNSKEILEVANLHILVNDDANEAIHLLTERLKDDPENIELLTALLEIYDTTGNLEDADKVGQKILQLSSDDFKALCILAQANIAKGQFKEALEFTNRAKILKPGFQNVILLENISKLFLSKPEDSQLHESILEELEKLEKLEKNDLSNLNHHDKLKLEFVLSTTKIAMKNAGRRDNNIVIDYLDSNPIESKYLNPYIVACYEKWVEEVKGITIVDALIDHIKNLQRIENRDSKNNLLAHINAKAGQYYLKESTWKKSIYHFEKAISLDPDNEEYKKQLAVANLGTKTRKRKLQILFVSAVLLVVIGISFNQWLNWKAEKALFDSVKSGIYPEKYLQKYPEGSYIEEANAIIDSLDAQLISVRMDGARNQSITAGAWQRMYHLSGGSEKIIPTYDGGYIVIYSDYFSGGRFKGKDGIEIISLRPDGNERWRKNFNVGSKERVGAIFPQLSGGFTMAVGKGLVRMSESGDVIWTKNITEKSYEKLIINEDGTYLIASNKISGEGFFLSKDRKTTFNKIHLNMYDSLGQQLWNMIIGNDKEIAFASSLIADNRGGYVLLGWSRTTTQLTDKFGYYLVRIDSSGNRSWEFSCDDCALGRPDITDIICTRDGGYLLAGSTGLIKLNMDGQKEWLKPFDWDSKNNEFSIVRADGDIYHILASNHYTGSKNTKRLVSVNATGDILSNTLLDNFSEWENIILTADDGLLLSGRLTTNPNPAYSNKPYNTLVINKLNMQKKLPIELTQGLLQNHTEWKGSWKAKRATSSTPIQITIMNRTDDKLDGYFIVKSSKRESVRFSGTINKNEIKFEFRSPDGKFNLKYKGNLYGNSIGGSWSKIERMDRTIWATGTFYVELDDLNL